MIRAVAWCSGALAFGGLALEIVNLFEFPLLRPQQAQARSIVACLAVRNEAANVVACLESLLRQPEIAAIVVCDDHSDDATFEILAAFAESNARIVPLRVGRADPYPAVVRNDFAAIAGLDEPPVLADIQSGDRAGKSAALACAARRAAAIPSRMLLFTDADVRLNEGAAGALLRHADALGVDAVSAWPRSVPRSRWDALFVPLVPLFLLQALPLRAARRNGDPRFSAANGQLFLVSHAAYERSGGHMPGAIVEDVALARSLKRSGARLALVSAAALAWVDGYGSLAANVRGYGRSLYYGTGRRGAIAFALWQGLAYVAPWPLLRYAPRAAGLALAATITAHALVAQRMRATFHIMLPALSGTAGVVTALWGAFAGPRGRLSWRGRSLR